MTEKILIVDDDPNVLKAYERRLRRRFEVETALCSEEGVTAVNFLGPFAVVVSDMMMPRENGAEFLARILQMAPDSVRIMLTGNADQQTAAAAINRGRVFKFLNKPCEADVLESAIREGIAEYRRVRAERDVLSQTVVGAVDMLSKVLSLASPEAFGRGGRLRAVVTEMAQAAGWGDAWRHEAAALLSQVGYVAVPTPVLNKHTLGLELTAEEQRTLDSRHEAAAELIATIPRLEPIARIVAGLDSDTPGDNTPGGNTRVGGGQSDDGTGDTDGPRSSIDFGVRLLRLVHDYDELLHTAGLSRPQAYDRLSSQGERYSDECLAALQKVVAKHEQRTLLAVGIHQLADGMHLVADVTTADGALLVTRGQDVTPSLRRRLVNYADTHDVRQPIEVLADADLIASAGLESLGAMA
ncbi:MAG: HD domain-containing phosphohydrolase [Planctomycetota bacterium]